MSDLQHLLAAIVQDDQRKVTTLLKEIPGLAHEQVRTAKLHQTKIFHWLYVGDTALHLAAAGYRVEIVQLLLDAGAVVNAIKNHRRSSPLHYAADGFITGPEWDAERQVKTIQSLLEHGADIDLQDKNGATALHRAVRTRCAAAAQCLLKAGADPIRLNKPGSTPFHLAVQNTGRGGSGEEAAVAAQREIIETFLDIGVSPNVKTSHGKSVRDSARSLWIQKLLG